MCVGDRILSSLRFFFFSSRRRHTRWPRDWSSDVCSSDLGLTALYDQCDPKRQRSLRHVVSDVTTRVQGGETFHESIAKHPRVFNRLFVSMVKAGESGGLLAEILERLAGFLEASARLRKKVKSAMTYPVIVVCIA